MSRGVSNVAVVGFNHFSRFEVTHELITKNLNIISHATLVWPVYPKKFPSLDAKVNLISES